MVELGRELWRSSDPDVVHEAWLIDQKCDPIPAHGSVNQRLTCPVNIKMQTYS